MIGSTGDKSIVKSAIEDSINSKILKTRKSSQLVASHTPDASNKAINFGLCQQQQETLRRYRESLSIALSRTPHDDIRLCGHGCHAVDTFENFFQIISSLSRF